MNAAEQVAAQMAGSKVFGDYQYLNKKFGRYKLECSAIKITDKGKPCIELKVIEATKTVKDVEPHKVGEVVSYIEDVANEQTGGGSRMLKALLAIRDMTDDEISKVEIEKDGKIRELEGPNAKRHWLVKFLNQETQPCAFLPVVCEVEPRPVAAKGDKPAAVFSKERWSTVSLTEAECDAIDAKRAEAKLPNLADAMK